MQRRCAVLKMRSALRSIKFNCVLCRKRSENSVQPMVDDLPAERLSYGSPPFFKTGMGYFGTFYVSVICSSEKRWGFHFTFLKTRALHIELVPSISMKSCVMGIEMFIARRGKSHVFCSENGTNLIATEKDISLCIPSLNQKLVASQMSERGNLRHLNPPSAPTMLARGKEC